MASRVNFLGVVIDNMRCDEALVRIEDMLSNGERNKVFFVNAHCINTAYSDAQYRLELKEADLVLPDGSGLLIGSRILRRPIVENLNGTDLLPKVCVFAAKRGLKFYLLGGKEGVAKAAADRLEGTYPGLKVVGMHHGYFQEDDSTLIIDEINRAKPDILLVALGVPLQEKWAAKHMNELDVRVCFGVGGLLDFLSQRIPRAPIWVRAVGMEWLWRFLQEPRRLWKRYLIGNLVFMGRVFGGVPRIFLRHERQSTEWKLNDHISTR